MLLAPTVAKHNLTAPPTVKSKEKQQQQQQRAAALISSGLQHFNQQQQQNHRQHHNNKEQEKKQQEKQQQQQQQQQHNSAASSTEVKQQPQQYEVVDNNNHVPNKISFESQPQQLEKQQQLQQLTMEAMKKLDAKLVAYLTGENLSSSTSSTSTPTSVEAVAMEQQHLSFKKMDLLSSNSTSSLNQEFVNGSTAHDDNDNDHDHVVVDEEASRELLFDLFSRMSGIKLQMEALTLQPEGTKRMELLQNDIRPIFTVECQLSHELIKLVPHYEMFHIMQFESEKFQSLTQCTRFGQEAERAVKLENPINADQDEADADADAINNNNIDKKLNFGRLYFTVWWREPGTCLNEMLGMGVLALEELYAANVLEQCKRIIIQRRNVHLANLYLKISVQVDKQHITIAEAEADGGEVETIYNNNSATIIGRKDDGVNDVNTSSTTTGVDSPVMTTVTGEYNVAAVVAEDVHTSFTGRMRVEDTKIQ